MFIIILTTPFLLKKKKAMLFVFGVFIYEFLKN